mgnify:CR=1
MNIHTSQLDGFWLSGIWDDNGNLVWSSEPTSFDTEQEALEAAEQELGANHEQTS